MEKVNAEAGESSATAADDALTSLTSPPSLSRVVGASTSRATAPSRPSEQHAASALEAVSARGAADCEDVWSLVLAKFGRRRRFDVAAFLDRCHSVGLDSALPPPHPNGDIAVNDEVVADANNVNRGSAPTNSLLLLPPCNEDGFEHGNTTANGGVNTGVNGAANTANADTDEQWEAMLARSNEFKCQGKSEVEEARAVLWWAAHIANENRLLDDTEQELNARLKQAEEEEKKEANLKQSEDHALLERLLLQERRVKMEEEEASRSQRILQPQLPRWNSHDGVSATAGYAAHYAGTNTPAELIRPLIQPTCMSASTAVPHDNQVAPAVIVPPAATPKAEDETWNKRQIGYVFFLGMAVALLFLVRPLLPHGYDRFLLAGFAAIWGLGSFGFPAGIFGTTRWEKNCSRHIGRLISWCFSLMVIYSTYLLAVLPIGADRASTSCSSPSLSPSDVGENLTVWRTVFGIIAAIVSVGHIISWLMGYFTGGDRDLEP